MIQEEGCGKELAVQAAIDGELDAIAMAEMETHWETCPSCAALRDELADLSKRVRAESEYEPAPAAFRAALLRQLRTGTPIPAPRRSLADRIGGFWQAIAGFTAGASIAAASVLFLMAPAGPDFGNLVVADHVRALQPGHLLDVASNNQHNVRPWFNGKLDFAPPVKNLSDLGYPLAGGRLDYLNGRTIAVLIYQRRLHPIEMLIWPDGSTADTLPVREVKSGYTLYHWSSGGMTIWVISDLIDPELGDFVQDWRK